MVPIEGSEEIVPADLLLIAAGFLGSQKYVTDAFGVAVNARTNVDTRPGGYETSVPGVFAAGDTAPGTVPGGMGYPRGKRSGKGRGLFTDGIYESVIINI